MNNNITGNAIEVRELVKHFGSFKALQGIDFSVQRGSVYGFLGPNGAGKTTTIKVILGLIAASSGKVKVLDEPVQFGRKLNCLRHINYLPQDPVFPEGLTGKEALTLVADIYGLTYRISRSRIEHLLDYFHLGDAANRKVSAYSRGMQQRLGIAAVLLTEPELLILDEPVSALDPEGRRKILDIITRLKGRATVFFSSHILADVERICDHITIIERGIKLLEIGTRELLNRYAMEQYLIAVKPEQRERTAMLIREHHSVRKVTFEGEKLVVISKPGEALTMAEQLLPQLILQGIVVTEFAPKRTDLEEAFFAVLEENHKKEQIV
ncbi:MAG TPA: ABC transporter ATP-binding protein [Candidatus Limnocylindrales bacterium]|nr:ABC transporter ATP-binding protein [Candidatus Limnocylindrales bacterium]